MSYEILYGNTVTNEAEMLKLMLCVREFCNDAFFVV